MFCSTTKLQHGHQHVLPGLLKLPPAALSASDLQCSLHTEAWGVCTEQNSICQWLTSSPLVTDFSLPSEFLHKELKAKLLTKTLRPCKRKSLPLSAIFTHYPTSSTTVLQTHTTYSLTEPLSVPLICCFHDSRPSGYVWCLPHFPSLLPHFCPANSCVFLLF